MFRKRSTEQHENDHTPHNIYRPCSSVTSYRPVSARALKKENVFLTSLLKIKLSYFTPMSLTIWQAESRWFALRGICAWCTALYHQATSIKSLSAWREMLQVCHCSQVLWDLTKSTCHAVLTNSEETAGVAARWGTGRKYLLLWSWLVLENKWPRFVFLYEARKRLSTIFNMWTAHLTCDVRFKMCFFYSGFKLSWKTNPSVITDKQQNRAAGVTRFFLPWFNHLCLIKTAL